MTKKNEPEAPPARKPREEPPPGPYLRSGGGRPARLKRITRTDITGRLWLYRLDYGDVVGSQEWTLPELLALDGVRWLQRCPHDLKETIDKDEPAPATVGA